MAASEKVLGRQQGGEGKNVNCCVLASSKFSGQEFEKNLQDHWINRSKNFKGSAYFSKHEVVIALKNVEIV